MDKFTRWQPRLVVDIRDGEPRNILMAPARAAGRDSEPGTVTIWSIKFNWVDESECGESTTDRVSPNKIG